MRRCETKQRCDGAQRARVRDRARRRVGPASLVAMLVALAGCGESTTSLLVVVTADPDVRERSASVRLQVTGGHDGDTSELDETHQTNEDAWPLRAVIVPMHGDASRPVDIALEALDANERAVARIRAAPAFEAGRTRVVALHFEASCLGVLSCAAGQTCSEGRCVAVPRQTPDAGVPSMRDDGGAPAPRVDAGPSCRAVTSYADVDGDGWGDDARSRSSCEVPAGYVSRAGDCDDTCAQCTPRGGEICDGARDEDCDGRVDEDCECVIARTRACPGGDDVCVPGVQTCLLGRWGECDGRVDRRDEECNARDDDCDGRIDEDLRRGCGRGCHSTCVLGVWGPCRDGGERCDDD
ncbi:hypothetical protein DB32_008108 [Sandaracinus amylolyticus]|uniref:Uncharacterized protein n=2 Tax=Sandaracinus amylolyticus TaxID=927083 RepID=A0A0F6SHS6_9BACT|nr:hypothetical protein DB32_008108 [Sandaracinus amylolyticus]